MKQYRMSNSVMMYLEPVFLDIKLPDMSGFDIAHYLRKNYEEGIYDFLPPLIAFTANVMHSEEEYQNQGMDGVLRKPLSLTELRQCFKTFLGDDIETTSDEEEIPQSSGRHQYFTY